jgi:hypothetical protein
MTLRETARMFETAGVARTERKYYITPQSVEAVIQEEIQRAKKSAVATDSVTFGSVAARVKNPENSVETSDSRRLQELEREIIDLKIANRGKDYLLGELNRERQSFFEQLLSANRTVGQLKAK